MERALWERRLAIFSIVAGVLHFFGETWAFVSHGSFLPMLIVDYIAIALLLFAGARSLRTGHASGLLCGAWGFTACLFYRAFFWRVEVLLRDEGSATLETMTWILGAMLVVAFAAFLLSLFLANPRQADAP